MRTFKSDSVRFFALVAIAVITTDRALADITLGPETIVPIPANPVFYYASDSRFPYLANSNGTANITFWVDGANYRSEGQSLDTMNSINPATSVLSATAGAFDNGGTWMQAAIRHKGTLYGFYHAEDHSCTNPYTEWNSTGLAISTDDGMTWTKQGQILGSPNECAGFGGIGANSIAWDAAHSRWMAWGGTYGFVSTNDAAAPGTWYGYNSGSFSTPMPGSGSLTGLPGLNNNISVQSVAWNSYLNQWAMVYQKWGVGTDIFYTTSVDGINWAPETTLLTTTTTNVSLGYVQIIGDTGESCGQDALLVYERFPGTQPGRSRDMIERWIHWGTSTIPMTPTNVSANGRWSCQTQVVLKWKAVPQVDDYNILRSLTNNGPYTVIGSVATSASFPTYTDMSITAGTTYYYEVQAANAAGTSDNSCPVNVVPAGPSVGNAISISFTGGTTGMTNILMDCSEVAGVVPASEWNNAIGAVGALPHLVYNAGEASDTTVSWSSANTWSTGIADTAGNYRMMKGYLDGSTVSVVVSNIPAAFTNAGYDVYVYSDGDATSGRTGSYTVGSTSIQSVDSGTFSGTFIPANNSAGNYIVFTNLTTSRFTLNCQGVGGGDGVLRAPVNGLQIVAATLPSPDLGCWLPPGGNRLVLTWPSQYRGWWLQSQTNFLAVGSEANWISVTGSALTNQVLQTINPGSVAVFFRLISP